MRDFALFLILIGVAAQLFALVQMNRRIQRYYEDIRRCQNELKQISWYGASFAKLLDFKATLPLPDAWAAGPDFLAEVINRLKIQKPQLVVELGSGLSTIVIGATLRDLGQGRLCSIEHDARYASRTRALVDAHGLSEIVEIRLAPLTQNTFLSRNQLWYDTAELSDLASVDLLVVDGPPTDTDPEIRFPALPAFWDQLSPSAMLLLDDASREGEKRIAQQWREEYPSLAADWVKTSRGLLVLARH